jgi:uncharacterized small protein (DUF1192 family)
MSTFEDSHERRVTDRFGIEYVVSELSASIKVLSTKIESMATKAEVARVDSLVNAKADKQDVKESYDRIDARLSEIEHNQAPPWMLPAVGIILTAVTIALHFVK